jgi:hypothetical protein
MKRLILLVGFLFVISILPLLAEQSNISEPNYPAIEIRLLALEERLDTLEQRINQLEKPQPPIPTSSTDPDKNEISKMRCNKIIQDTNNAIELIKTQIENLPFENETSPWYDESGNELRALERRWRSLSDMELKDRLEAIEKKWRLLADEESNYLKIIHLAEKYPYLEVNVIAVKKDLIKCQGDKKNADLIRWRLRKIIEDRKKKPEPKGTHHREDVLPKGY